MPYVKKRKAKYVFNNWDQAEAAIQAGKFNPYTDTYHVKGIFDNVNKNKKAEKLNASYDIYTGKQDEKTLLEDLKEERKSAQEDFDEAIANFPIYERDQKALDELTSRLNMSEDTLRNVYEEQKKMGGSAIDALKSSIEKGQTKLEEVEQFQKELGGKALEEYKTTVGKTTGELARAEQEAKTGLDKSLDIYRKQARRSYLPGQAAMEDKLKETTAGALSNIKKYSGGRGGLSSLTDIYKSQQEQERDLGIAAAQNKQNLEMQLASAEAGYGTTMADLIRSNALVGADLGSSLYSAYGDYLNRLATTGTNVATNRQNMGLNLYSAQSDYMNKLASAGTNLGTMQAQKAGAIYDATTAENVREYQSKVIPAEMTANFAANRYTQANPYPYAFDIAGRDVSMGYADKWSAENAIQQNNQMMLGLLGEGLKLALSVPTGGASLISSAAQGVSSLFKGTNLSTGTEINYPEFNLDQTG